MTALESAWPETLTLDVDRLLADPSAGSVAIAAADALAQRLTLAGPLRFGADPGSDMTALRFLAEVATHLVDIDWMLAGEPPWPVRTTVHLPPPGDDGTYARQWRDQHRFGLCTYRRGPGFVRLRDIRPGGPHLRILIDGPWADAFDRLLSDQPVSEQPRHGRHACSDTSTAESDRLAPDRPVSEQPRHGRRGCSDTADGGASERLLAELVDAGLAIRLGSSFHLLPVRLRRWPIPYTDV